VRERERERGREIGREREKKSPRIFPELARGEI